MRKNEIWAGKFKFFGVILSHGFSHPKLENDLGKKNTSRYVVLPERRYILEQKQKIL